MRKTAFLSLVTVLVGIGCFSFAHAQVPTVETIPNFQSTITVNLDNSVSVNEIIEYDASTVQHHGIYRDITPVSSEGRNMDITNISVTDPQGVPYQWVKQYSGSDVQIKIGDPNSTFTGKKTYLVNYTATQAVAHLKDVDEIYWNATGNNWNVPILKANARIILPQGIDATQSACYYGPAGSKNQCSLSPQNTFDVPTTLAPGEGLTVAAGFPKGIVPPYSTADNVSETFHKYVDWILAILLPMAVLIVMYARWHKRGRDPKGRGVIIPQYDVPDNLTPMEVACIVNQRVSPNDFSAEIVYLATQGYLKIKRIEDKILGFIKTTDYQFVLQKSYSNLPSVFDSMLLDSIFDANTEVGSTKDMSKLKDDFYKNIPGISDAVVESMLSKAYYSNLKKSSALLSGWSGFGVASLWRAMSVVLFVAVAFGLAGSGILASNPLLFVGSIVVTIYIVSLFNHIMPAKTEKGVLTKEYILGLKEYLQIAEKERINFQNAPEKKPEVFEKFLPYAMVLGVNEAWAKEFENIYTTPPSWYEGYPVGGTFNSVTFSRNISNFSAAATSSLSSSPGGSGGGGSSGGGGGGGGGGGW